MIAEIRTCYNQNKLYIGVLGILIVEYLFFSHVIGNDLLFGDDGDGLFTMLVTEHWYRYLCGLDSFMDLRIFYPLQDTIAGSDLMVGMLFPYIILRFSGIEMYLAYKITLICIHIMGVMTYFYFLHRCLKFEIITTIIGVALVFDSSAFASIMFHTQFFAMGFVPVICVSSFYFYECFKIHTIKRIYYALFSLIMLSLLFYTSWYIGFYFLLFLVTFTIIGILYLIFTNNKYQIIWIAKKYFKELFFYVVFFFFLLLPFFYIYLPVLRREGSWTWDGVLMYIPHIGDLIDKSFGSTIFNPNVSVYHPEVEISYGIPVMVCIVLAIAGSYYIFKNDINTKILCISVLVSLMLIVRIHDYSLWYIVYKFVPGGGAIRAVSRYNLFLAIPISLVLCSFLKDISLKQESRAYYRIISVALLVGILQISPIYSFWNIYNQELFLKDISEPSFNLPVSIEDSEHMYLNHECQLKAWQIANKFNLSTIQGITGVYPDGWNIYDVHTDHYKNDVKSWMAINDIDSVQLYDLSKKSWEIVTNTHERILFQRGWYAQENFGRWSKGNKQSFKILLNSNSHLSIWLKCFYSTKHVKVYMNGDFINEILVDSSSPKKYEYLLSDVPIDSYVLITFQIEDDLLSPKEIGMSSDNRKLGIGISKILLDDIVIYGK